jgi:hypothetical protein
LNRFAARYRAAKLFVGIQYSPDATDEWQRGFSALLKVFLAYSAAESFRTAKEERGPITINLNDSLLAEVLRNNENLLELLRVETRPALSNMVKTFQNRESDDVGCIAAAVRHLVAHGTLTVGGANVGTLERSECILRLAEAVLLLSDREFSEFCNAAGAL